MKNKYHLTLHTENITLPSHFVIDGQLKVYWVRQAILLIHKVIQVSVNMHASHTFIWHHSGLKARYTKLVLEGVLAAVRHGTGQYHTVPRCPDTESWRGRGRGERGMGRVREPLTQTQAHTRERERKDVTSNWGVGLKHIMMERCYNSEWQNEGLFSKLHDKGRPG